MFSRNGKPIKTVVCGSEEVTIREMFDFLMCYSYGTDWKTKNDPEINLLLMSFLSFGATSMLTQIMNADDQDERYEQFRVESFDIAKELGAITDQN